MKEVFHKVELFWEGKQESINLANLAVNKKLTLDKLNSKNWETTENLYIKGDNLEALKILQNNYRNKIKVIYIDPPYNTRKNFVYADSYTDADWCSMIYPRLLVAKELISKDGVIFISIDDNELSNLKLICDEIFGKENFITQFVYEKTQHFGRHKLNAYSNAEYILCYAKSLRDSKIKELLVERVNTEFQDAPLYNRSNNINTVIFPEKTVKFKIKDGIYKEANSKDYELLSPVKIVKGENIDPLILRFKSRWSQKKIDEEIKKGTTFLIKSKNFAIRAVYGAGKTANNAPKQIIFTNKNNKFCTYSRFDEQVKTVETATSYLSKLFGENFFSYPKPVSLIKYLLSLIYDSENNDFDKNFIVLDFFSGSATTAQAVMELNASDDGNRKYILIQKPELFELKSTPYKKGYKTICDLGLERINKTIEQIKLQNPKPDIDNGIKVYEL